MERTRVNIALVALLPLVLAGCEHAVWGNMTALGMTLCLFFGTLQLGKRPAMGTLGVATSPAPAAATVTAQPLGK